MIAFTNHLGQPDAMSFEEAHSSGRTHSYVAYALGLPINTGSPYVRDIKALHSRMDDEELGRFLNMGPAIVELVRGENSCYHRPIHHWTPEEDRLVIESPPDLVARRTKRSYGAIVERRRKLLGPRVKLWTDQEVKYLLSRPELSHSELGRIMGRTNESVRKKRKSL